MCDYHALVMTEVWGSLLLLLLGPLGPVQGLGLGLDGGYTGVVVRLEEGTCGQGEDCTDRLSRLQVSCCNVSRLLKSKFLKPLFLYNVAVFPWPPLCWQPPQVC